MDAHLASLARWDERCQANVAPSRRNSKLLSNPWLRRPPGASPGVMHGTALRAELGRSGILLPRSGRSAESAKHTSPGQAR